MIKKQCEEYGFYYFNTFENRKIVMKQIIRLVKKIQKKGQ